MRTPFGIMRIACMAHGPSRCPTGFRVCPRWRIAACKATGVAFRTDVRQLVDIVEDIAGITMKRRYNLNAPKGVNGRNSDNTLIQKVFNWQPNTKLRDGMEKTYRWIYDEYVKKYGGGKTVSQKPVSATAHA